MIALMFAIGPGHAHDAARPELDGWYMGLTSKGKSPCCDGAEARHVADVDWETRGGHYRVRIDGQWIEVPDDAVVDGPNRDGRTLVWPYAYFGDGSVHIRCFMPGSMT